MTETFTLGILETGRPPEELADGYPSYAEMFARMVGATAPDHWDYQTYCPLDGELPASPTDCQAWLITGSKFGAYEDYPWIHALKDFIAKAYQAGVPMVGICFGHQILAESLGGKVLKSDKGWGVGRHGYHWQGEAPDWMAATDLGDKDDFSILAFHQDQVVTQPPEAKVIASSEFCEYAALAYGDQVISFQGHPEFGPEFVADLIESRRDAVLGDDVADLAMTSLETKIDKDAIGEGIVAFLKAREEDWKQKKAAKA
ncbi:GMP synthase - Glutamine amidotransferase [Cohaesibacter sp. ES.047]|uniref:glutamine amidotransferase-related protein n=1 Tax=Cohaesibacter sp. ES.047 TaxID=1798205 RepID=UPI000BB95B76|nr:gamma-glutamyl-gamma-aminobutyrate hydrolase family protein [Cohaesibacter sp. ES.047]SNY90187.1 GMP synthase - Glutamine amidotransferase [Cohaesibacter sp. ES.047]